jgi:hypothetical protein
MLVLCTKRIYNPDPVLWEPKNFAASANIVVGM